MKPERWREIEALFHEALERRPEERGAFLATVCGEDRALRAEVESLLAQPPIPLLDDGLGLAAAALAETDDRGRHEGRSLGPLRLGSLLGSGGMGDVYVASDSKLGRDVAVKILPTTVASHPDRLARFEREARILATLNHPNIAAIHGLEEGDGLRGLVLELVDGVTLKEKLDAGAAPLDESLRIGRQIALALEAAHQKGIVHRDLKPANIKINSAGVVKVLDFGLAKIDPLDSSGPAALPVLATRDGVVLGTVAYMSPEQARGLAVDKRTDIWAFGCVLYEMLTGSRPFPGDTAADVLGAITTTEPDWARLPADTARRVRDLLRRCLTKDPDRRLRDIGDARIEIEEALEGEDTDEAPLATVGPRRRVSLAPWIMAATLVAAATVVIWIAGSSRTPAREGVRHLALALPSEISVFATGRGSSVAVSPDGERIVYVGLVGERRQLYMRSLDEPESTPIAGTENATSPFFSPDGKWIGFTDHPTNGSLKKVPVGDGTALTVVSRAEDGPASFAVGGADWGPDGSIFFSSTIPATKGLWRVDEEGGGSPVRITTLRAGEQFHAWPQVLPGGDAVLYTTWNNTGFDGGRIVVQSLAGGEPSVLVERASYGRVVSADGRRGWLVYARPDGLYAAPFDLQRLRVAGSSMPVLNGVLVNLSGGAHFSFSASGLLAYVPGGLDELNKTAVWVDRSGTETEIGVIPGLGFQYRLSRDGRRLVRPNAVGPARDLWIDDLVGGGPPLRLTRGGIHNGPVWTPDGERIIYSSGVPAANLFWRSADGTGDEERLTTSASWQMPGSVSPDGAMLAYVEGSPNSSAGIWLLPLRGVREPQPFLRTPFAEMMPMISPDGRWLAYQSNASGAFEIYLGSLTGGRRRIAVSTGGGSSPRWSPDGRELYYRSVDPAQGGDMMVVAVDLSGPEPKIGRPRVLFPSPYQGDGAIAPDGRFLLLKRTPQASPSRVIHLVFNWFEELQAKVPLP
jgi:eukaryotic-like serine/threonine-protein kinase